MASHYLPGTQELEVGGDWYDADPPRRGSRRSRGRGRRRPWDRGGQRDGAAAERAPRARAERRRALAAVEGLDRLARAFTPATLATIVYAELDLARGDLHYVCAGHPPPVLMVGGDVRFLEDGRTTPLVALPEPSRVVAGRASLPPGSTLVLYSDGLIERRGEQLDVGMRRLADLLRGSDTEIPRSSRTRRSRACWERSRRTTTSRSCACGSHRGRARSNGRSRRTPRSWRSCAGILSLARARGRPHVGTRRDRPGLQRGVRERRRARVDRRSAGAIRSRRAGRTRRSWSRSPTTAPGGREGPDPTAGAAWRSCEP